MASNPTPEFRTEVVRVALTSGLPRKQVATDFGVGFSTLSRWIPQDLRNPEKPSAQFDLKREVAQLRKEALREVAKRLSCFEPERSVRGTHYLLWLPSTLNPNQNELNSLLKAQRQPSPMERKGYTLRLSYQKSSRLLAWRPLSRSALSCATASASTALRPDFQTRRTRSPAETAALIGAPSL
ncbi:transposase [Roseovarius sp. THAF9]|uniref:transposase n=1 Tax=Roseovarius sp. THAF9 TaxID=2587847 RepID=UPI0034A54BB3